VQIRRLPSVVFRITISDANHIILQSQVRHAARPDSTGRTHNMARRNFSSRISGIGRATEIGEETMRFEIGSRVKWKEKSKIRLGFAPSDHGRVVGVKHLPTAETHLDVEFDNGDVVHGLVEDWIETVEAPEAARIQ
jgi:hypothetical protein